MHDVLVIGAGPAGSVAARGLSLAGLRVLMVDKARFPRRKVCGCCLNGNALAALKSVGLGDIPAKLGAVPLTGFTTATAGRIATVPLKGVSLSREAFDMALIEEAVKAGVEFREGFVFPSGGCKPAQDWTHSAGLHPPLGKITVYANGLNGIPSTASKHSRLGAGTILNDAPAYYEPGRIFMAVGQGGYVGLVRLEDGRLDVAAAFDADFVRNCGGLGFAAERVLKEAGFPCLAPLSLGGRGVGGEGDLNHHLLTPNPSPARVEGDKMWKGTPALTRTPHSIAGPGWFAVGDAAGYVEPFTGEGMAWAICGAAAVVPFVLKNDPLGWIRAHRRLIGTRQRTCRGLARLLRSPSIYGWAVRGLKWFPALAQPVVRALNRKT